MSINTDVGTRDYISRYIFGSALYSEHPHDIDVALIYDKAHISVEEAIAYRHELGSLMSRLNDTPIDAILLTLEEEREMEFLENAKHMEF